MITDKKILFIDDDVEFLALVEALLKRDGFKVFPASNGSDGLHAAYEQHPDLIILDVSMPGQDGFDVCKSLREITSVPIIMLTARTAASDIKRGFAAGADDYIKKPFSNDELLLRVRALLRRGNNDNINSNQVPINNYSDGVLNLNLIERSCAVKGTPVSLTATEFNLLSILVQHPNHTLSIRTLLTEVWGDGYSHDKGVLSLYIHQLRQKLQDDNEEHKYIQTQWGRGYSFNPLPKPVEPVVNHKFGRRSTDTHKFDRRSTDAHNFDRRDTDRVKPARYKIIRWFWVTLIVLMLIFMLQPQGIFGIFARPVKVGTSLETLITAEGFFENDLAGVRGQICVTNSGQYPTENLSIVNSVQIPGQKQNINFSTTSDVSQKAVLDPNDSYCYPYVVTFEAGLEKDEEYMSLASITITNYLGMLPGTDHCPGTELCSFGPNVMADFTIPKP